MDEYLKTRGISADTFYPLYDKFMHGASIMYSIIYRTPGWQLLIKEDTVRILSGMVRNGRIFSKQMNEFHELECSIYHVKKQFSDASTPRKWYVRVIDRDIYTFTALDINIMDYRGSHPLIHPMSLIEYIINGKTFRGRRSAADMEQMTNDIQVLKVLVDYLITSYGLHGAMLFIYAHGARAPQLVRMMVVEFITRGSIKK